MSIAIIKGQGTTSIEVATAGIEGKQVITTLELGGYPPDCPKVSHRPVQVRNKN